MLATVGFRAVLFRMVPKHEQIRWAIYESFRAVLFRMVPKPGGVLTGKVICFRAVLFRMVPKLDKFTGAGQNKF